MQMVGYVIYAVGILFTILWLYFIRSEAAKGAKITGGTLIRAVLFIAALVAVLQPPLSPLHLTWMFPAGWFLGTFYLVFPISLLLVPGQLVLRIACLGLDPPGAKHETKRSASSADIIQMAPLRETTVGNETISWSRWVFDIDEGLIRKDCLVRIDGLVVSKICVKYSIVEDKSAAKKMQKALGPRHDVIARVTTRTHHLIIDIFPPHQPYSGFLALKLTTKTGATKAITVKCGMADASSFYMPTTQEDVWAAATIFGTGEDVTFEFLGQENKPLLWFALENDDAFTSLRDGQMKSGS
jgi:uncharacterized membrane protein